MDRVGLNFVSPESGPLGINQALPGVYPDANLKRANAAMNLTPQEQALYMMHLRNLYPSGGVPNPDGGTSTLYQVGFDHGGRTYNVPSVYDGKINAPDDAITRAIQMGLGQFPSYRSPFEAENRYQRMHNFMERDLPIPRGGLF